jgi:hypothetical protein
MSEISEIVRLIKSFLPKVGDPEGIDAFERDSADFRQPRLWRVTAPQEAILQLEKALLQIPEIAQIEGGLMHSSPASQARFVKAENFAHWLLAQSRFRAPEDCCDELLNTVRRNESSIVEIIPIWGISPRVRFDLGNALSVWPIADLPASRLKDLMTGKKRHAFSFEIANSFARPGAVIVRETTHGPLFEGPHSEAALKSDRQSKLMLEVVMARTVQARQDAMKAIADLSNLEEAVRGSTSIALLAEEMAQVMALLTPKPVFTLGQRRVSTSLRPVVMEFREFFHLC